MNAPLELTGLCKSFGVHKVLDDITIALNEGEIFGLVGLNGAGKTTMIKIILGLLSADSGNAKVFGNDCQNPKTRGNLCYLPEKFTPSIYLEGREFVEISTSYHGKTPSLEHISAKADALSLSRDAIDKRVGKYSKGMGQKVGLIATLLSDAPLLILDEPMSGLDPKARILLKNELLEYKKSRRTIFFSSHILADLEEICDRIAVLHDSHIIYTGTPAAFVELYNAGGNLERAFLNAISSGTAKTA